MTISVIIESRLSGPAAGHAELNLDYSTTINDVIEAFCIEKGTNHNRQYVLRNMIDEVLDLDKTLIQCGVADGDTLYLTRPKENIFGFHNWYVMAGAALLITLVGLAAINVLYSYNGEVPDDYGIVFDAGSTHTTMAVYEWVGAKLNNTGTPKQIHQCNIQGISNYPTKEKLEADIKRCLNEGKSSIPGGKVGTTPVFLGATAGMRLLDIKNHTLAEEIMQTVDGVLSTSGFYYTNGMARIISGTNEGANGWTTTNYAENLLTWTTSNISNTGTLDLGGASTQFATMSSHSQMLSNVTIDYLTLYGASQNVSVNSYLCFGYVQSFLRHQAQLTSNFKNEKIINDPCLPKGFNVTVTLNVIFDSPCTWMTESLRPSFDSTTPITFVGTSNPEDCFPLVAQLFNQSLCEDHYKFDNCFIHEDLGSLNQQFLAISGFYDIVQFLNLSQPNLTEYTSAVNSLCNKSLDEVRNCQKKMVSYSASNVERYCFEGMYVGQLLTSGYNFTNSTWAQFLTFQNTINGIDLGWSMGFMINATNSIAAEMPVIFITVTTYTFLTVLFIIFLFVSMAFGLHAWIQNRRRPIYQRLSQYGAI